MTALKQVLETPVSNSGLTQRRVIMVSVVYHEEDFPMVGKDK